MKKKKKERKRAVMWLCCAKGEAEENTSILSRCWRREVCDREKGEPKKKGEEKQRETRLSCGNAGNLGVGCERFVAMRQTR